VNTTLNYNSKLHAFCSTITYWAIIIVLRKYGCPSIFIVTITTMLLLNMADVCETRSFFVWAVWTKRINMECHSVVVLAVRLK